MAALILSTNGVLAVRHLPGGFFPGYVRAMTGWGQLYRDHVDAVAAMAPTLTPAQLETPVPASPEWTVHEVLAHMAGVPSDMLAGRMDGAPGPAWTCLLYTSDAADE